MKNKETKPSVRVVLFESVLAKFLGEVVAKRISRKAGGSIISMTLIVAAFVQVITVVVWASENISKLAKLRPSENVLVIISGAASHFYPAHSRVTLNVDVAERRDPANKVEAKEDQLGLFYEGGESAGFEKKLRFPAPMEFYQDALPPSQYSVTAQFTGNEKAKKAKSDIYSFTVFEEDRFDPTSSPARWYQVEENGAKTDLHDPFLMRPDPASHKGEYLLFLQRRGMHLASTPMLWYRSPVALPCELHLTNGPIGAGSGLIISFEDIFRVVMGDDPDNQLSDSAGPNTNLTVYQKDKDIGQGTFSEVASVAVPRRLFSVEQSYRVRLVPNGPRMYVIELDVPGTLPAPIRIAFESSLNLPTTGNIGFGLISRSGGSYIRDFQLFAIRSK